MDRFELAVKAADKLHGTNTKAIKPVKHGSGPKQPVLRFIILNVSAFEIVFITYNKNSLHAKFFRGNIHMYLPFMSFLHTDMP